ncbi:DUF3085 domain-containing protein [Ferrovum sp.]|uniref:DUF3085 domain-containing protein n=1 Tax=Ferrovum sp. TaxID=2609467 RepID=UPI00260814EF|nr:DUF3085 domain-containing protein [Ferrovum sp.]
MAGILRFNVGEVRKLYNHSMAAKEHFASARDAFEDKYHKGGKVVMQDGVEWPDAKNIDTTLIPAAICLVGDQGVYLMSNGLPPMLVEGSETKRVVAYAKGVDPRTDEEWYRVKRDVFGGDDGVEHLPLSLFSDLMEMDDDLEIRVSITQRSIRISAEPKSKTKTKSPTQKP